jgi:hypothetical protein
LIDVQLLSSRPRVVLVVFSGQVLPDEAQSDRRFGELVKSFKRKPFRVLCDFRNIATLEDAVAETFLRAQSFALKANLERDAFVTADPAVRAQCERISHDTRRVAWLGPLRFFDSLDEARAYLGL